MQQVTASTAMTTELAKTVWSNQERTRHFLIPDEAELPPGSFVLRTVVGRQRDVDEAAALAYEVSREEAKAWLSSQMSEVFGEAKDRLLGFLRKAQQEETATPPPKREPASESSGLIIKRVSECTFEKWPDRDVIDSFLKLYT